MRRIYWKQLAWMIFIWVSSVGCLAIIACCFRVLMTWAGLKIH